MRNQYKRIDTGIAKGLYGYLNLSDEQLEYAAAILETTRARFLKSRLSFWERFDYEQSVFSNFLASDQMEKYLGWRNECIENYKNDLIEQDNSERTLKDIKVQQEEIGYLENEFLPALKKTHFSRYFRSDPHSTKLAFIKSEYKTFLDENHMAAITDHVRDSRHYQPNELKAKLLRHKVRAIYPDFRSFRIQMDDVVKGAADYLSQEFRRFPVSKNKVDPIVNALWAYREKVSQAHDEYLKETGAFYFYRTLPDKRTHDEKEQDFWFPLLLIDEHYYGYK
jgi:hypothetical protein